MTKLIQYKMPHISDPLPDSGFSKIRASWSKSSRVIYNKKHWLFTKCNL